MGKIEDIRSMYNKIGGYICCIDSRCSKAGLRRMWAYLRHGTGIVYHYLVSRTTISDYFELGWYRKSKKERKAYLLAKEGLRFAVYIDGVENIRKMCSKREVYTALQAFVPREQLFTGGGTVCTFEQFADFAQRHPQCIYKPDGKDSGAGVEKWELTPDNMEQQYQRFIREEALLDELVEQHPKMKALNSSSVNTVRVLTLRIENETEIICTALRVGNGTAVVDNFSAGGMGCAVDPETGIVLEDAIDIGLHRHARHPVSNVTFQGFQIPNWEAVLNFTKEASAAFPLRYAAWDIAVCEDGCALIEVNPNGSVHVIQTPVTGGRKAQFAALGEKVKQAREKQ